MTTILIIEDDEELLLLVKKAFELNNFKPYIAKSIEEGLKIFKNNEIDLIFADVILKDGNMINRLNEFLTQKKAKVILTTGYSDVVNNINSGEIQFFIKPYDIERVIQYCSRLFSENRF